MTEKKLGNSIAFFKRSRMTRNMRSFGYAQDGYAVLHFTFCTLHLLYMSCWNELKRSSHPLELWHLTLLMGILRQAQNDTRKKHRGFYRVLKNASRMTRGKIILSLQLRKREVDLL